MARRWGLTVSLLAGASVIVLVTGFCAPATARDRVRITSFVMETAPRWWPYVDAVDEALAQQDIPAALAAWREAHSWALASPGWEGLLEVGHAGLRIADTAGLRGAFVPRAREHYLTALLRARHSGSVDGVLSAAESFATIGDLGVVRQSLLIAASLVTRQPSAATTQRIEKLSRWTRDQMMAAVEH